MRALLALSLAVCSVPAGATPQAVLTGILGGALVVPGAPVAASTVRYTINFDILEGPGAGTSYESSCTGTLIAPRKVLTAAHCFGGKGSDAVCVDGATAYVDNRTRAGSVATVLFPGGVRRLARWELHPRYNQNDPVAYLNAPDLALLTLSEDAPGGMRPAELIVQGEQPRDYRSGHMLVAGFGSANEAEADACRPAPRAPPALREVAIRYRGLASDGRSLCLGNGDCLDFAPRGQTPGLFFGDSGGPAFWVDEPLDERGRAVPKPRPLAGVNSYIGGGASFVLNIEPYLGWINSHAGTSARTVARAPAP